MLIDNWLAAARLTEALSEKSFRPQMEMPLPYEPPKTANGLYWARWMRPLRCHVVAFAFFVPFALMLAIHRHLGLSDAMMVAPSPGQSHSILYNMLMIAAFWIGVGGYILHVLLIADRTPRWVFAKLTLLAIMWAALIWVMP